MIYVLGEESSKGATQPSIPKPQDGLPASELARSAQGAGGDPTPLAFLAVTQLLEACVASLDMPKLQDIVEVTSFRLFSSPFPASLVIARFSVNQVSSVLPPYDPSQLQERFLS